MPIEDSEAHLAPAQPDAPPSEPPKKSKRTRNAFILVLLVGASFAVYLGVQESRTSAMQARIFTDLAGKMTWKVQPGLSKAIRFPHDSPYDERLGYSNLPDYIGRLSAREYQVGAQSRMSPKMLELAERGIFPVYHEKTKTGLTIYDCRAQQLYATAYPERI